MIHGKNDIGKEVMELKANFDTLGGLTFLQCCDKKQAKRIKLFIMHCACMLTHCCLFVDSLIVDSNFSRGPSSKSWVVGPEGP